MLARKTGFGLDWESSPVNWASVFQEATNLLPPDDLGPPPPYQPQLEMGSHEISEYFIKRLNPSLTPMGSDNIDTDLELHLWKLPDKILNDTTSKMASYDGISRSYLVLMFLLFSFILFFKLLV